MSSAFFAINAFCFKRNFLLALLQQTESADWKSSMHRDARQTHYLYSPSGVYVALEESSVVFQSNSNQTQAGR